MNDEVKQAAARLRQHAEAIRLNKWPESPYWTDRPDGSDPWKRSAVQTDEATLADAFLPLLDPTPIEGNWLVSVGCKKDDHPQKWTFDRENALPIGLWIVDDGWKAMLIHAPHAGMCIVRGLKTRGDVRQLCAAILTESEARDE